MSKDKPIIRSSTFFRGEEHNQFINALIIATGLFIIFNIIMLWVVA